LRLSRGWDITPCSPVKINRCIRGLYRLHLQGRCVSQARNQHGVGTKRSCGLADSWTLKMETTYCFEKSVDFHRTARSYIYQKIQLFNNLFVFCSYYFDRNVLSGTYLRSIPLTTGKELAPNVQGSCEG
jgi:hypothetical protein